MSTFVGRRSARRAVSAPGRRRVSVPAGIGGAALALGVAVLSASPATAARHRGGRPDRVAGHGRMHGAPWERYVQGPSDPNVRPVAIVSTSGDVP
jgi:hypothetical protein